jgi:hypothetical protein
MNHEGTGLLATLLTRNSLRFAVVVLVLLVPRCIYAGDDDVERLLQIAQQSGVHKSIELKAEKIAGSLRLEVWYPEDWAKNNPHGIDENIVFGTKGLAETIARSYPWQIPIVVRGYTKRKPIKLRDGMEAFPQLVVQFSFDPAREILSLDHRRPTSYNAVELLSHGRSGLTMTTRDVRQGIVHLDAEHKKKPGSTPPTPALNKGE